MSSYREKHYYTGAVPAPRCTGMASPDLTDILNRLAALEAQVASLQAAGTTSADYVVVAGLSGVDEFRAIPLED